MKQSISTSAALGQFIVGMRKQRGWSQAQLAARLGISQNRLSVLESAPGTITVERLLRILGAFNLHLSVQDGDEAAKELPQSEW